MIYNKTSESIKKTIKSSIALMLIPFISSIIIFTILIFTKDSYIKENEETEFNSTVEYIESDFDNVLKLSGKLINSESYRIAYSLEDYRNLKDDEYNTIREYLKLMKDKVSFIDHAICVLPGGFYISDQESNDIRYLSAIYEYYENNIDEAYNNLSNVTSELSFEIKNKNQVFGYIKLANQGINLNIIILANSNTLSSYLNQICDLKNDGYFYLSSNSGYLVGIEKNNDHSGANEKIENKLSKFYTSESKKSNLKYFYYISKSNYQSLNILIYGLSIFSILLCIIVFILLIISIYKKKYIPLLKIKEKLDSKIIGSSNMSDQELIKKIDKLKTEEDSKIDLLSKRYVINETFRRIINGIHNEKEVSDIFSKYSLDLNNKKLTTIIIKSDSFNELVNELKESNMEKEIMALCDKRISLIKEYYSSFKEIVIVEEEKEVILIVSSDIDDSDELIIKKIKESSNKYQERLRNDYSIDSIIAIGIPVIEIDKINESYKKALSTREFIELLGSTNEIASYFSLYDRGTLSIDILPYKDLRDMIRLKDFEKAKKQTIYVIDKEIISNDKKELMIKMYSFIDRLNTEITGAISNYSPRFIKELDVTRKLMNVTSIKELKETTNEIYDSIISSQGNITDDEFIWIEKVKEYIRLNYSDKSLSVSALADEFHFSLSYFSRMFKLKTGYGINEFINEVRIDEAKAMLKKGMTVIEVSEKCGFMDSRSLIRTFKSFYGDTPSKYKNK